MSRLLAVTIALCAATALPCDKLSRTTTFLGWTADSRMFAWRVYETCVACKPKWHMEHTFVRTTAGGTTEYITRWESEYPRPDAPGKKEWDAWVKKFPLQPGKAKELLAARQDGVDLKPKAGEFCAKKEGTVSLVSSRGSRDWRVPSASCGCARGFVSPDSAFVAWITGPAKRVCDDCHGAACCGEVEALMVHQDG